MMEVSSEGISTRHGNVVRWTEICALHATEVDTMTGSVTILQFEHESGHYIEIDETDVAYMKVMDRLASFLPLGKQWINNVHGLEPGTGTTIWTRGCDG